MRQKRAKTYKKLMALYALSFGFRQPYQVLVDSLICKDVVDHKIDLVKQLGLVLQGTVKPMITQCCIHELYLQGKQLQPVVDLAKTFERRKCNHREAIPGDECLASVVGESNKHRYVVASQSQPLRAKLRQVPGVPLVHINRIVVVLEPPSDATIAAKKSTEEQSLRPKSADLAHLEKQAEPEPTAHRKKRPKAPNPLSVKKKKTTSTAVVASNRPKAHGDKEVKPNVGEKRKRVAGDESGSADARPAEETHTGPKRKRRKKATDSGEQKT
ncbi:hypothetical protein ONZ45_g17168 [Pleurotus djamor]|nr:hypothetical protein ONZ45_g17168 [Pleurotus djamor]